MGLYFYCELFGFRILSVFKICPPNCQMYLVSLKPAKDLLTPSDLPLFLMKGNI